MSNTGITLLTTFENFRDKAYRCQAGVWTIGWGTTRVNGQPVREGMTCTPSQAMQWKATDIAASESALARLLPSVKLEPHQHDAVVSFIYNCGAGASESSTLRKRLRAGLPVLEQCSRISSCFCTSRSDAPVASASLVSSR